MYNQEAITLLRNLEDALDSYCELNEEGKTAFRMAIEALSSSEIPNSSDCISRQAAINEIDEWIKAFLENGHKESAADARLIQDGIIQLPSAQPVLTCKGCKYDYYEYAGCRNCLRRERDLYEPE